jgi:hypothetical protein
MIELIISNIDEFNSKFVAYKADSMKLLLQNTLQYIQQKEEECRKLREWQEVNQPTGICETCTAKSVEDMYKYKKAVEEIEASEKRVCDACKEFTPNRQSDISCRYCQPTQILNIIKRTKEQ